MAEGSYLKGFGVTFKKLFEERLTGDYRGGKGAAKGKPDEKRAKADRPERQLATPLTLTSATTAGSEDEHTVCSCFDTPWRSIRRDSGGSLSLREGKENGPLPSSHRSN